MMASLLLHWKSNKVCLFPQKLLISHWLPVLSGSNPEMAHVSTQGVPGPRTPKKKTTKRKDPPSHHPLPPKKKRKKKKGQERKRKEKKRELSLRILPRRTRLLTSLYREKARKAWPTATILMKLSNLVRFMYARNIKLVAIVFVIDIMNIAFCYICFIDL